MRFFLYILISQSKPIFPNYFYLLLQIHFTKPNGVESMSSNCRLMEPSVAFVVWSCAGGKLGVENWGKWLGDASSLGWLNHAFKASDMHNIVDVLGSRGPKWASRALDRHEPHSCPLFLFSLMELTTSSGWVQSVDAYSSLGGVRELLSNSSLPTCRDESTYCCNALSI